VISYRDRERYRRGEMFIGYSSCLRKEILRTISSIYAILTRSVLYDYKI